MTTFVLIRSRPAVDGLSLGIGPGLTSEGPVVSHMRMGL